MHVVRQVHAVIVLVLTGSSLTQEQGTVTVVSTMHAGSAQKSLPAALVGVHPAGRAVVVMVGHPVVVLMGGVVVVDSVDGAEMPVVLQGDSATVA
jgi:hypothetical protein